LRTNIFRTHEKQMKLRFEHKVRRTQIDLGILRKDQVMIERRVLRKRPITNDNSSDSVSQDEIRKVAREYQQRGWKVLAIPTGRKHPKDKDWQLKDITADNVESQFHLWHGNIGVQFGPVSGGLCDVDLDCSEARALAAFFLPETAAVFGRESAPAAHWLYVSDRWKHAKTASTKFEDPVSADGEHGVCLVELRSGRVGNNNELKGALSVFPPSTHPSGELVRWDKDGEPAQVDADELIRLVATLAAAALLVRHYPPDGKKHQTIGLVLGGFLARAGWNENRIATFVEAIACVAGDNEWQDRVNTAKSAVSKFAQGENIPGRPRMNQVFGRDIVDTLSQWLNFASSPASTRSKEKVVVQHTARSIEQVLEVFERWLLLQNLTPVYAVLGTIAANLLPGEPVWLGLVAPPSSAKTELLNSTSMLSYVVETSTLTLSSLLSGTPKKQQQRDASGGLLRQIGEFGVLVLKDFGSVLSMRPEAKNEVLAALREIYDGAWTRHLGTDGGKTLAWQGKVGLLFGVTGVIDQHHGVIGTMGDRFLLSRLLPSKTGQLARALEHAGGASETMRTELARGVAGLFAAERPQPRPLTKAEFSNLDAITGLVVRLRGSVVRDPRSKEIDAVYGAEGTARLGLTLERLLAGLDTLGVNRDIAFEVVEQIAFDSVPPQRLAAYEYLRWDCECEPASTTKVAEALGLPTNTARRKLEELAAYRVIKRIPGGQGKADEWRTGTWGRP
jgi:hypothetical protein